MKLPRRHGVEARLRQWKRTEAESFPPQSRPRSAFIHIIKASAHWRPGCWRDVGRAQQTHAQGWMASVFRLVQDGWIQPDSTFQTFCHFFLTNSSSSVLCAYNYIRPDLERFEQPFFFITCLLLLLHPLPLLLLFLFPPLHHFHPRSAFVNSCPERECAVCTRLCVCFITFPQISDRHFLFVCFGFFFSFSLACSTGFVVWWSGCCHGQMRCHRISALWQKRIK